MSDDLRAILSLFHFRATFGPTLNLDNVVCHDASWHRPACAPNTHAAESYSFPREAPGTKHTSQMAHLRMYILILTIQPLLNYASGTGKRVITFSSYENEFRAQQVSNHQAKLHNFIVVFQYLGLIASASCDHGSVFINTASLIRFILTNP